MKRFCLLLALSLPGAAQTPDNELLRSGRPEAVLAAQPSRLDWAEALMQLAPYQLRSDVILKQLEPLPDTPEVSLVRARLTADPVRRVEQLRRVYQLSSGPTHLRACASLAVSEAKIGHQNEAMKLLSEAFHGGQAIDQSWLDFEIVTASSEVHTQVTPDQPEWGNLLQLRERCRQRQDWFWAAKAGKAIFERLRLTEDWRRTADYALASFDDAEKTGSRLLLWSLVQNFATGIASAPPDQMAQELLARAQTSPYAFAYLSGLHWFKFDLAEYYDQTLAAAQNDWEAYQARLSRTRFRPERSDLVAVHQFEMENRTDPNFMAYGPHLSESSFHLQMASLETEPALKASLLWKSWQASTGQAPTARYNLMLDILTTFERMGDLAELLRANLTLYQHVLSLSDPIHYSTRLYSSPATGAAALTSDWDCFFGSLMRQRMAAELEGNEQKILRSLDQTQDARSKSSDYIRLSDLFEFQERELEALEAARCQVDSLPAVSYTHRNLAWSLARVGQDEEALEQFQQALDLEAQDKGFGEEVSLLSFQARCLIRLGRLNQAEVCLDRAQALAQQRKFGMQGVQAERTSLLRAQKRWPEAEQLLLQRAAEAPPLVRLRLLLSLAELYRQQHQDARAQETFASAESLAEKLGGGACARVWLAWCSPAGSPARPELLQKAQAQLQQLAGIIPQPDRELFLQQPSVAAVLAGRPLDQPSSSQGVEALSKEAFLNASALMRQRYPQWEELSAVSIPALLELQPRLGSQEVFLGFTSLAHQVVVVGCDRHRFFLRQLFFERDQLERQVLELRQRLSRPGGEYRASARRLYDNLLQPMQKETEGKQVWLACQGALLNLPWTALQDQQGRFVVEHWASHKLWWGTSPEVAIPNGPGRALLLAAPGQHHLDGVITEVESISQTLKGARRLVGPLATRANLARWLPACHWLHLAAHSSLNRSALQNSYVELSDGSLPLSQLYGLKLRPQTTVVLSSCQTALGQNHPGKDVISLGSGFRLSGAGQVLATLWPVDDDASVEFFKKLYPRLSPQMSLAPALHATARELLKKPIRNHPFYWAAYQLEGEMFLSPHPPDRPQR